MKKPSLFVRPATALLSVAVIAALPAVALAQDIATRATAEAAAFVDDLNRIILFPTIALLSGVAFLVFIYGCFLYIAQSGSEQARAKGVQHITWGIVGLVIMLSAFAILRIVTATFGLDDELQTANEGGVVVPNPNAPTTGGGTGGGAPIPVTGGGSGGGAPLPTTGGGSGGGAPIPTP